MKLFLVLAVSMTVLTGCSSDDKPTYNPPPAQTMLITKQTEGENPDFIMGVREFTFDNANRIVSELTNNATVTYTWTNGKISKKSSTNGTTTRETTYEYDSNGQLIKEEERNLTNNSLDHRYEYIYFANHFDEKYYNSSGEYTWRYEYYYDAGKKNVTSVRMYSAAGAYSGKYEYAFDDKNSVNLIAPYTQFPEPFYNANNRITLSEFTNANEVMETVNYTFDFNAMGYPTVSLQDTFYIQYDYTVK